VFGGIGNDSPNTALLTDQNGRPIVDISSIKFSLQRHKRSTESESLNMQTHL
jgi:hypothetical protein